MFAVVSIALSGKGGAQASAESLRRGPLTVTYSAPWSAAPTGAGADGVRLATPLTLFRAHRTLTAGELIDAAAVPGGPPPGFLTHARRDLSRRQARVGGLPAIRYAPRPPSHTILYVIPTDRGDLGVLCQASGPGADPCAVDSIRLSLRNRHPVPPGADPVLNATLRETLSPLASPGGAIALDSSAVQIKHSAQALVGEERAVLRRLANASSEPRDRAALEALCSALRWQAAAFKHAAKAAAKHRGLAYVRAASAVELEGERLLAALHRLRVGGFTGLPQPRTLSLPALPPPASVPASSEPTDTVGSDTPPTTTSPHTPSGSGSGESGGGSTRTITPGETEKSKGVETPKP